MNNIIPPTSAEAMDRLDALTPEQVRLVAYWLADKDPAVTMAAIEYAQSRTVSS